MCLLLLTRSLRLVAVIRIQLPRPKTHHGFNRHRHLLAVVAHLVPADADDVVRLAPVDADADNVVPLDMDDASCGH
jgi:hypothetical protein